MRTIKGRPATPGGPRGRRCVTDCVTRQALLGAPWWTLVDSHTAISVRRSHAAVPAAVDHVNPHDPIGPNPGNEVLMRHIDLTHSGYVDRVWQRPGPSWSQGSPTIRAFPRAASLTTVVSDPARRISSPNTRCVTNCVTTAALFGYTVVDVRGHSLSLEDHLQACALDLRRQRSVVQVHLGPPCDSRSDKAIHSRRQPSWG